MLIGTDLGHFSITAQLGEGGMGEVYRAADGKLGREVAVKVLPAAFVADAERLARFEREARVLASLSHPRIAGIFEIGRARVEEREIHYLVMELAAGETLAARLAPARCLSTRRSRSPRRSPRRWRRRTSAAWCTGTSSRAT
ncbi:MAG: protein kinase [Thermoanaerobaculia bacterium]|nr:protein kinase [Thermoanaerobaculia bacterium]